MAKLRGSLKLELEHIKDILIVSMLPENEFIKDVYIDALIKSISNKLKAMERPRSIKNARS
jgi:hypothetical protein